MGVSLTVAVENLIFHKGKKKESKHGYKLKLLPFLNESIISFEIFSEH